MAIKNKRVILCKGMTYEQYCSFEDERDAAVKEYGDNARQIGRIMVDFVFKHVYPEININELTYGEVWAIVNRTLELSGAIREEEIKNLKPLSDGSTNEAATAKAADK